MTQGSITPTLLGRAAEIQAQPRSGALVALHQDHWFIRLRWAFVAVALAFLGLERFATPSAVRPTPLVVPILLLAIMNLVWMGIEDFLLRQFRRADADDSRTIRLTLIFSNAQVAVDLALLTVILRYTGGVENPMALFYLFHMSIGALLLPPSHAVVQGLWAMVERFDEFVARAGIDFERAREPKPRRRGGHRRPLFLGERLQSSGERDQCLVLQAGVREIGEQAFRDLERRCGELALERLAEILLFAHDVLLPAFAGCLDLGARGLDQCSSLALGGFARLDEQRIGLAFERLGLLAPGARFVARARLPPVGLGKPARDARFALVHRVEHRPVEETLEQPDQHEEVDQLRRDREPVDLHLSLRRAAAPGPRTGWRRS